jgi:hypothetical protein
MNADRHLLEQVRLSMRDILRKLERSGAPAGIADHVGLALARLESFLGMTDRWDAGNHDNNQSGD